MLLRDHPLMSYKGIPNWPPAWTWIDGLENKRPRGKSGFSKRYHCPKFYLPTDSTCILIMRDRRTLAAPCLTTQPSAGT